MQKSFSHCNGLLPIQKCIRQADSKIFNSKIFRKFSLTNYQLYRILGFVAINVFFWKGGISMTLKINTNQNSAFNEITSGAYLI